MGGVGYLIHSYNLQASVRKATLHKRAGLLVGLRSPNIQSLCNNGPRLMDVECTAYEHLMLATGPITLIYVKAMANVECNLWQECFSRHGLYLSVRTSLLV